MYVPALLQGVPDKPLQDFGLEHYEISPVEPLHDVKGHISNLLDEIRVSLSDEARQKVDSICAAVLNKETLRGSDYRKGAILILSALQRLQPTSALTALLQTAVEITEILYSDPEKRSPQTVLRLHNLTYVHAQHCTKLFGKPKTMSMRKMFGRYFHSLTTHSALLHRIVAPHLLNTKVEERMFGQCKSITKNTSNQRTNHIVTNILVRMNCEERRRNSTDTVQMQEKEVSKLARCLPPNKNTKENSSVHYQAHLERISDFLLPGPGVWWQYIEDGVEFFDISNPNCQPSTPSLQYFRSTKMGDVDLHLFSVWEKCLEENVQLPASYICTYTVMGLKL